MKKLKVMHFINTTRRGGLERQVYSIVHNSRKVENNICSLYYKERGYFNRSEIFLLESKTIFQRIISFSKLITAQSPDIILSWSVLTFIIATIASIGKPIIIVNGSIRHGIFNNTVSGYFRLVVLHLSKFIISNSYAGLSANKLRKKQNRYILYNGKEEMYKEKITLDERINRLKRIFPDFSSDEIIYISVANLVPYKDYRTVFYSLAKLVSKNKFRYIILGEGPMRKELELLGEDLQISDRVYFAGSVENVLYYLQIADVMLHSSKGEGVSNAILEGMFAGLPIIATNVGGIPETVYHKASVLFNYQDTNSLVKILSRIEKVLSTSRDNTENLQEYLEKFSSKKMITNYEKMITEIYSGEYREYGII